MYTQPELREYQDEWLRVERELAIKSMEIWSRYTYIEEETIPSENNTKPINEP